MKIALGNDHTALEMKAAVKQHLEERGIEVLDLGTHSPENCDYPVYGEKVGLAVAPEFFREEFQMRGMKLLPFAENLRWEIYGAHRRETAEYENIRLFVQYLKRHLPR